MKGFTFIGVFVVSFVIVAFVSFIVGSIPGDSEESNFAFNRFTACFFFAAYIAWNMVAKNG